MLQMGRPTQSRSPHARVTRGLLVLVALGAMALATAPAAMAWKPYAHLYIGDQTYNDARDGSVTFGGRSYALDSRLVTALHNQRDSYNAGVVGPDGFPDLGFGQSVIHPNQTGKWLAYILDQAWKARTDPRPPGVPEYTESQRQQILAFAYGFLVHAAGDMWGHTLINDFAGGLFPSFGEFTTDLDKAKIGIRHIAAEGYAGSATPGWDRSTGRGNRRKVCTGPSPKGTKCDDTSDDTTPGIQFAAPHKFLYNILVSPNAKLPVGTCNDGIDDDADGVIDDGCPGKPFTHKGKCPRADKLPCGPEPQRGPFLDFFLDLEARLQIDAKKYAFDAAHTNCSLGEDCHIRTEKSDVKTVRGIKKVAFQWNRCTGGRLPLPVSSTCRTSTAESDFIDSLIGKYLEAWVEDIRDGLHVWTELSLAYRRGSLHGRRAPASRRDHGLGWNAAPCESINAHRGLLAAP
jgi:hypothetical protein